jgi:hypothetical protein
MYAQFCSVNMCYVFFIGEGSIEEDEVIEGEDEIQGFIFSKLK